MTEWEAVVGLEIHVHLKTRTKMFCRCETGFGAEPNTHTCPVCLAHPGALPVANRTAVEWTIKLGLALGSEIAEQAVFARKNYFYPDNPKGYQISQYDQPLCVGGAAGRAGRARAVRDRLRPRAPGGGRREDRPRRRRHRSEDRRRAVADRLQPRRHAAGRDRHAAGHPLGRAGRALPPAPAADDRRARHLRRAHGGGDAPLSTPTSPSVRPGSDELRTRWELKNMNSFRFIGRGIEAAVREQVELYERGGEVEQHTYDYEPDTDTLTPHRSKEEADDYRYFPEPDLVPVEPEPELVERLRGELPELPADVIRDAGGGARGRRRLGARHHRPRSGLPGLWWRAASPSGEAFNFAMNQPIPEGANLAELAKVAKAAKDLTREAADGCSRGERGRTGSPRTSTSSQTAVSDTGELEPIVDGRSRRQPRPGRGVPRRQGGPARLLRRPGDEGDRRQGEPEGRERARCVRSWNVVIDEANDALQAKGYSAAHLHAVGRAAPGQGAAQGDEDPQPVLRHRGGRASGRPRFRPGGRRSSGGGS